MYLIKLLIIIEYLEKLNNIVNNTSKTNKNLNDKAIKIKKFYINLIIISSLLSKNLIFIIDLFDWISIFQF